MSLALGQRLDCSAGPSSALPSCHVTLCAAQQLPASLPASLALDWARRLPADLTSSDPPSPYPNLTSTHTPHASAAGATGDSESWAYAHRCAGAWTWIRPTIINDTQAAFATWAAESNYKLPQFEEGDTVIQSRCSPDTILKHSEYGPVAFRCGKEPLRVLSSIETGVVI